MLLKERTNETRSAILDAAIGLFTAKGFETTPMDEIAVAANVAKGTLYYHYDSKEGIVNAIVERDAATVEAKLAPIEADIGLGFAEKFASSIAAITDLLVASFSKLHRMKYIDIRDKTLRAIVEHCAPHFARIFEQGNAAGICRVEYPLDYAEILLASTQSLLSPSAGVENFKRRIKALARLSALAFGMDPETVGQIYKPLEAFAESLSARDIKDCL
jgi:AcrR family transcriptional regulator